MNILSRVGMTIDGVWIGWLDLLTTYTRNSGLQVMERYYRFTHPTVPFDTRTKFLSLH
jgi:hypothetical protein